MASTDRAAVAAFLNEAHDRSSTFTGEIQALGGLLRTLAEVADESARRAARVTGSSELKWQAEWWNQALYIADRLLKVGERLDDFNDQLDTRALDLSRSAREQAAPRVDLAEPAGALSQLA